MELITKKGDKKNLIFGKYKLTKIIGSGSFGYVYEGINVIDNKKVAVKVENKEKGLNLLEKESFYLYNLKGVGLPEVISFGYSGKYNILVQSLLGESLGRIFYKNKNTFSLKDICMFSIQILHRIEHVHSKYIIHRDIKPENFLIGNPDKYLIYIIDFGLSKKYKSSRTNKHVQFRLTKKFTGTARYASLNAIRGAEQSRRDDLEAIGYMLLFFFSNGKLPWQGVSCKAKAEKYSKIYYMKKTLDFDDFCKNMPKEIITYMLYCRELDFEQKPDYNYLRGLFENVLKSNGTFNDLHFSWIKDISILKNNKNSENKIKQINMSKRKESPQSRIFKKLESSRDTNKDKIQEKEKEKEKAKIKEIESENDIKSLKTNNSLQNIQNIVILKYQTTPQNIVHKKFNSSGDNILFRNKDSENYKSGIAQYDISIGDEDQINNKTFTNKKGNINSIQKILNKNLSYNKQNICKNNLYYFSGNINDLSKSLVMKNMNHNKLNEYGMEQNNINNQDIKKQNTTFFNHNRLLSSNSINRSASNNYNIVSQNIMKSFSFINKNKPKIEENKETKENININLSNYNNQKYNKSLITQKFSFNKNNISNNNTNNNTKHNTKTNSKNDIKYNTNNNTNTNKNNNNHQIKKKEYNFKNKYKSLKISSYIKNNIQNGIKKQNTNINISKNKNNTYVNKINNNNTSKNKQSNILNQTKVKKLDNTTVKKDKKRKIIKMKIKNIPNINIQISSNNLNCKSAANILKKNTSPNDHNNIKFSFIQNINNKRLKKENQIKTENFSCNNNFNNNIEGKINKIKSMQIHSNIKKKDSLNNYKKITTKEIFKHNINNNNKKNDFNNYNILNLNQSRINKYKNLRHKNAKKYENYPTQKSMTGVMDSSIQKPRITNQTINSTINNCNTVNNTINTNNNTNTIISIYNNYNIDKNNKRYGFIHKKIDSYNIALDTLKNINKENYKNNYSCNGYKIKLNNYKSYINLNPRKNTTLNNMPSINQLSNYATLNSKFNNDSNHYNSQVLSNKDFSCHDNYPIKKMSNYFSLNNFEKDIGEFNQKKMMNLSSSRTNLNSYRIKEMLNEFNNNNNREKNKNEIIVRKMERNKTENYMDLNTKFFLKNNKENVRNNKRYEHSFNINRSNSFLFGSNYLNFGFKNQNLLNKIDNNLHSINRKNTEILYQGLPSLKMNYNIYDYSNIINKKNEPIYKHNRAQSRDYYDLNYNSNRCKRPYDIFS